MNILIPDSWLREYLKTDATPEDIQRCLSLCGPSVERTETIRDDVVYDIEVTTNRVDSYSVYGIAREAAAILPRFGFKAALLPFASENISDNRQSLNLKIIDTKQYCRRILAIKIDHIALGPSPTWLKERLEKVGQRPLNNVIDITNYIMWETGHPCHAFDYDRLSHKTIIVTEAKKGQTAVTLDNKQHVMRGGELIFDDGTGEIIDIPGIMGTANSVVTDNTKNILLFIENSDPAHIRHTSMGLGIRTQAATINEKGPDPELAYTAMAQAITLTCNITGGVIASKLFDRYPKPYKPHTVSVSRQKVQSYMDTKLKDKDIQSTLTPLGFDTTLTTSDITVSVPSWRRDITIDVDIIEEIARIYGYHNINNKLPEGEIPMATTDPVLTWEEEIKIRLRDWGYTELMTYSMISETQMDALNLDKTKAYKIANPLSEEWMYMRPAMWPGILQSIQENLNHSENIEVFEIGMNYTMRANDIPDETPILIVAWSGNHLLEAKGVAQSFFHMLGIPFPKPNPAQPVNWYDAEAHLSLGTYGSLGLVHSEILSRFGIKQPVTILELEIRRLVKDSQPAKTYTPVPKYPPVVEDLTFVVPNRFAVGPLMEALKAADPLVADVTLLDVYENTRTVHVTYLHPEKNLTDEEVQPVRKKLIRVADDSFGAALKGK